MLAKFFCVLALAALSHALSPHDFSSKLRRGVKDLFETGKTTQDLADTVGSVGFEHFLSFDAHRKVKAGLVCEVCETLLDGLFAARRNGTDKQTLVNLFSDICRTLNIQTDYVCDGLLESNADIVLYIVDNKPEVDGSVACPFLLQSFGCEPKQPVNWSIRLHEGETIEKAAPGDKEVKIVQVTDIHYDPTYTVGSLANCKQPLCCQYDSGPVLDPKDATGKWLEYNGCDTPLHTLQAAFDHIKAQHKNIDYIYFTGDIISHRLWATDVVNNTKDMITILDAFKSTFGDIPVYPVVGNHEPHPLNVWSPNGIKSEHLSTQWVFDVVAEQWGKWLPESTKATILRGGYYTVLVNPRLRIIALNSNVCYTLNWWLLFNEVDPFGQLEWMENTLFEAEQNGEAVHILSHVPSGDSTCHIAWAKEYVKIIRRYSNTISAIFNGHTHDDQLIIYYDERDSKKAINVAFDGGSITSYSDRNPSYKVYSVDNNSYDVLDYEEWTFNVTEANQTPDQAPVWFKLYSFKNAYSVRDLSPSSLNDLALRMTREQHLNDKYYRYKVRDADTSMAKGCNVLCQRDNLCAMVTAYHGHRTQCDYLLDLWEW